MAGQWEIKTLMGKIKTKIWHLEASFVKFLLCVCGYTPKVHSPHSQAKRKKLHKDKMKMEIPSDLNCKLFGTEIEYTQRSQAKHPVVS